MSDTSGNTHASSRSPLWPPAEFVAVSGLSLLMGTSIIIQAHVAFPQLLCGAYSWPRCGKMA